VETVSGLQFTITASEAERPEALRRVNAAVVELDPLADAVRARAEDDHPRLLPSGGASSASPHVE
jgi:hypothetical protein